MAKCCAAMGVVVGVLAAGISASNGPQPTSANDEVAQTAIVALLKTQQNDWNNGRLRAFMAGYWNSPELTFAGSKGFTRGWEPVFERYEKTYVDRTAMGKLDFSELEVRSLGPNAALVLGRWHLQRQIGDIGGIFTLVLQKFPEGWRIVHDHTTQSPPAAPTK